MLLKRFCFTIIFLYLTSFLVLQAQKQHPLFRGYGNTRTLSENWELDSATRRGAFLVIPYKPFYVLPFKFSSCANYQPISSNLNYSTTDKSGLDQVELKFQISLKTKVIEGIVGNYGDIWVGYTQKSMWQVYNADLSRPFRETNYEPEVILNFATDFPVLGFRARMFGASLNHQSNGKGLPLSRSWNRLIFHFGLQRENFQIYIRPWYRFQDVEDENPDITDNIGRGDLTLNYKYKDHVVTFTGTNSLQPGDGNRGSLQLDWAIPISGYLKAHLQFFHGYGETLIDYNHNQTIFGVGVSLIEWM